MFPWIVILSNVQLYVSNVNKLKYVVSDIV